MPETPYTQPDFEAEYACSSLQFGEYMHDSPRKNMADHEREWIRLTIIGPVAACRGALILHLASR